MSELKLYRFTFKEGQRAVWLAWCEELQERTDEVIASLVAECVRVEACFLSETEAIGYYLIDAEDTERSKSVAAASDRSIDKEHRAIRDQTIEVVEELGPTFDFRNPGL